MNDLITYLVVASVAFLLGIVVGILILSLYHKSTKGACEETKKEDGDSNKELQKKKKKAKKKK